MLGYKDFVLNKLLRPNGKKFITEMAGKSEHVEIIYPVYAQLTIEIFF